MINIIFDIDGTLVNSFDFDSEAYVQAIREVLGDVYIRPCWSEYEYVSDSGILWQILQENERQHDDAIVTAVRHRFGELISQWLLQNSCKPIDGALEAFHGLRKASQVNIGIATGGWGHTAMMKLNSAGFQLDGVPVVSSDHHYQREEIMKQCNDHFLGVPESIVYIGDAEWDKKAAAILNWSFVGVGPRLSGKTNVWVPDFTHPDWSDWLGRIYQMQPLELA